MCGTRPHARPVHEELAAGLVAHLAAGLETSEDTAMFLGNHMWETN